MVSAQQVPMTAGEAIPPVRTPKMARDLPTTLLSSLSDAGAPPVRPVARAPRAEGQGASRAPVVVKMTSRELRLQRVVESWAGPQMASHREAPTLDDVSIDDCGPVRDPIELEPEPAAARPWGTVEGFLFGVVAALAVVFGAGMILR